VRNRRKLPNKNEYFTARKEFGFSIVTHKNTLKTRDTCPISGNLLIFATLLCIFEFLATERAEAPFRVGQWFENLKNQSLLPLHPSTP